MIAILFSYGFVSTHSFISFVSELNSPSDKNLTALKDKCLKQIEIKEVHPGLTLNVGLLSHFMKSGPKRPASITSKKLILLTNLES